MTVYLVGAGPGDPELLTRQGATLLGRADVVIYDALIDRALLDLARPGAELIDVGKRPAGPGTDAAGPSPSTRQDDINALLVEHGRVGKTVVRLKGGDPFLFGRGGEEAEALSAAGIDWEVVPGVTSAIAVPALAGVPVTHRGRATSVTIVTGHVGETTAPGAVDWDAIGRAGGTVVVLMGMATRTEIARRLMDAGRPADTPVAVIHRGATPHQRAVRTTLDGLAHVDLGSPAVLVVGPVVDLDLAGRLGPAPAAAGHRGPARPVVAITRPAARAGPLVAALSAAGLDSLVVPAIATARAHDGGDGLARALDEVAAGSFDWVAFTSATAVEAVVAAAGRPDWWRDPGRPAAAGPARRTRLAAVGGATAAALVARGLPLDLVPARPNAAGLADALADAMASEAGRAGVLFPRALDARPDLARTLAARGVAVTEVVAYRTVPAPTPDPVTLGALASAAAVVLASPSAVSAVVSWATGLPGVVVCSGQTTAAAARAAGLHPVTAGGPEAHDLADAVVAALSGDGAARSSDGAGGAAAPRS